MSKFWNNIYKGSFYFAIIVFAGAIVGASTSTIKNFTPSLGFLAIAYAYALFIAFSSMIYQTKLNSVLKVAIHFLSHVIFFSIDFIYFGGYYKNGVSALYILLLFIIVYTLISLAAFAIHRIASLSDKKDESYQNNFKKY